MSDGREDEADELVREFLSESNESLDQFESPLLEAARVVRDYGAEVVLLLAVVDRGGTAAAMSAASSAIRVARA